MRGKPGCRRQRAPISSVRLCGCLLRPELGARPRCKKSSRPLVSTLIGRASQRSLHACGRRPGLANSRSPRRAFLAESRGLRKSGGSVKSFRQRWAVGAAGFALTVIAATQMVSSEARSDPEPPAPLRRGDAGAPATLAQCGDCHMIFPSRMLPSRSWTAILSRMDDHFGENAAIPKKDLREIRVFLTSNAADSPNASPRDRHFMSEILPGVTPLRITRTPWWNQMHADFDFDGVSAARSNRPPTASAATKKVTDEPSMKRNAHDFHPWLPTFQVWAP